MRGKARTAGSDVDVSEVDQRKVQRRDARERRGGDMKGRKEKTRIGMSRTCIARVLFHWIRLLSMLLGRRAGRRAAVGDALVHVHPDAPARCARDRSGVRHRELELWRPLDSSVSVRARR